MEIIKIENQTEKVKRQNTVVYVIIFFRIVHKHFLRNGRNRSEKNEPHE